MEPDIRFYRRRASEELAAANRAVTEAARERRIMLAGVFLERLKELDGADLELAGDVQAAAFNWGNSRSVDHA
ncbi:MAG: hypothetical protein ACJ8FO_07830 [Sphingomicrobium sp.]